MRGRKRLLLDSLPDRLDLVCEKLQVVDRGQSQSENFARAKQVMKIGSAEPGTGVTVTPGVERRMNIGEPALFYIDASVRSEQRPVTGQPGREDAVEQVDPAHDTHPDVFG